MRHEKIPTRPRSSEELRVVREAEGLASGALVGAAFGAMAGPPGAIAGAILGGVAGTLAGAAMDTEDARIAKHEQELDETIGVIGGQMGAPNLDHPPPSRRAWYSEASMGVHSDDEVPPAEGPIPPAEAD
ncbi:MAG TPA: glycine zipper domain-containing protein [Polyangiaceae bacterium]